MFKLLVSLLPLLGFINPNQWKVEDLWANKWFSESSMMKRLEQSAVTFDIYNSQYIKEGNGSAIMISADGYLLTAGHCVNFENYHYLVGNNYTGKQYWAKLIKADQRVDAALLKIDPGNEVFVYTPIYRGVSGKAQNAELGDIVQKIGNPLGIPNQYLLAPVDKFSMKVPHLFVDPKYQDYTRIRCPIMPGDSGSGAVRYHDKYGIADGHLVGIITMGGNGKLGLYVPMHLIDEYILKEVFT